MARALWPVCGAWQYVCTFRETRDERQWAMAPALTVSEIYNNGKGPRPGRGKRFGQRQRHRPGVSARRGGARAGRGRAAASGDPARGRAAASDGSGHHEPDVIKLC